MARVRLIVEDPAQRVTLRTLLESAGHQVGGEDPQVVLTDSVDTAVESARIIPTLLLATASEIPEAVRAMRRGVSGYVFVPLQPGEADLQITRALRMGVEVRPGSESAEDELRPLEEVEMEYIQHVLKQCRNNQARAARVLGIGRNTLWRKLKKFHGDSGNATS